MFAALDPFDYLKGAGGALQLGSVAFRDEQLGPLGGDPFQRAARLPAIHADLIAFGVKKVHVEPIAHPHLDLVRLHPQSILPALRRKGYGPGLVPLDRLGAMIRGRQGGEYIDDAGSDQLQPCLAALESQADRLAGQGILLQHAVVHVDVPPFSSASSAS